jgi:hypothetical protein
MARRVGGTVRPIAFATMRLSSVAMLTQPGDRQRRVYSSADQRHLTSADIKGVALRESGGTEFPSGGDTRGSGCDPRLRASGRAYGRAGSQRRDKRCIHSGFLRAVGPRESRIRAACIGSHFAGQHIAAFQSYKEICNRVLRKPPSELGGPMKARAQRRLFKAGLCFSQSRRADQVRIVQRSHAPQALAFTHHDLPRREFRAGLSFDEVPRHPIIQPSSERRRCYPKDTVRHSLAPADTILWRRTANAFRKELIRDVLKQC